MSQTNEIAEGMRHSKGSLTIFRKSNGRIGLEPSAAEGAKFIDIDELAAPLKY